MSEFKRTEIPNEKTIGDSFNSLPKSSRIISIDMGLVARINDLEFLKIRTKQNYQREMKYINDRIQSHLRLLKKVEAK